MGFNVESEVMLVFSDSLRFKNINQTERWKSSRIHSILFFFEVEELQCCFLKKKTTK